MSKQSRIGQFVDSYQAFVNAKPMQFFETSPQYSDFDGLSVPEAKDTLAFVLGTVDALRSADAFEEVSWNALNNMQGQFQNLFNTFQAVKHGRDQGAWQNFAQALDSVAFHVRQFGLPALALGEAHVERTRVELTVERERLVLARTEVERLRDEVRTLITPAVAGSLSQAFTTRRDSLFRGRVVWGAVSAVVAIASIWTTFVVIGAIATAMSTSAAAGGTVATVAWGAAIVRAAILLPLFAIFAFAFSQYRRERELEEEYAHKAAVATSLPNYGDLARDAGVRDQIVSAATTVIFTSPLGGPHDGKREESSVADATKLVDAFAKLASKR